MKKSMIAVVTAVVLGAQAQTFSLQHGWNLVGVCSETPIATSKLTSY